MWSEANGMRLDKLKRLVIMTDGKEREDFTLGWSAPIVDEMKAKGKLRKLQWQWERLK